MTKLEHNGWYNYETWLVNLWIDNQEGSQRYWSEAAKEAFEEAENTVSANARLTGHEPFTQAERATLALSRQLKDEFEQAQPELEGFWADLIGAALSEVNWHEIAKHMIEEAENEAVKK